MKERFFFRHMIDEIHGYRKGIGLVFERKVGIVKKSKAGFNNMSMMTFEVAIMLMCV